MSLRRLLLVSSFLMSALLVSAQSIIFVDADANGNQSGASWQDAFVDLSEAVEAAAEGDQIWVAAGVYVPTRQSVYEYGSSDAYYNHFTLPNGANMLGGFDGDETQASQRDPRANITVLSGDIDHNDTTLAEGYVGDWLKTAGDNARNIFLFPEGSEVDTSTLIDGLVFSGADEIALSTEETVRGLTVTNCRFYGNRKAIDGYGLYIIDNCWFEGNSIGPVTKNASHFSNSHFMGNATGLSLSGADSGIITVDNCVFDNNATGLRFNSERALIKNCEFTNNRSGSYDGAGMDLSGGEVDVVNCLFEGNEAGRSGGAIATLATDLTLINCKLKNNRANLDPDSYHGAWGAGAGIYAYYNSNVYIYNSLITGNIAQAEGSAIALRENSEAELFNVTVAGNGGGAAFYGDENSTGVISVTNSMIYQINSTYVNMATVYKENNGGGYNTIFKSNTYELAAHSPGINSGINSELPKDTYDLDQDGDTDEPIPYDLNGKDRVFAGIVDLGCYESQFETVSGNMLTLVNNSEWYNIQQYVDMGDQLTLDGTDFTIEMWLKPGNHAMAGNHHLCGSDDATPANRSPEIYLYQAQGNYDDEMHLHFGYGDGSNWNSDIAEETLKFRQWNHIAMTFDNTTKTLTMYANGKKAGEVTGGGDVVATPFRYLAHNNLFNGSIDEFRVWKEKRSLAQLMANSNNKVSKTADNLVLYYTFDQVGPGEIVDQAGLNNGTPYDFDPDYGGGIQRSDAILTPTIVGEQEVGGDYFKFAWHPISPNATYTIDIATDKEFENRVKENISAGTDTVYTVTGLNRGRGYFYRVTAHNELGETGSQYGYTTTTMTPPGFAYDFDDETSSSFSNFIEVSSLFPHTFQGATLEAWVKLDFSSTEFPAVWAINTNDYGNNYVLVYDYTAHEFELYNSGTTITIPNSSVNEGEWNHVAVSIQKDAESHFYLNGTKIHTFTHSAEPFPYGSFLSLGQEYDGASDESNFMEGQMDEFRVWDKALTETEVQARWNKTLTGNEDNLLVYYDFDQQAGSWIEDKANHYDGKTYRAADPNWALSTINLGNFILEASALTDSSFTLNWESVAGATSYAVDLATDKAFTQLLIDSAAVSGTSYSAAGLAASTKYYYRVTADNNEVSQPDFAKTLVPIPGTALSLDGRNDYLEANKLTTLDFGNQATLECWAKLDPSENRGMLIAINGPWGSPEYTNHYLLQYDSKDGYAFYEGKNGQKINSHNHSKGGWVHLAATIDAAGTCTFYLNGDEVGTMPGTILPFKDGARVSFGQEYDGYNQSDFLNGELDEIRIWDNVRTQAEIVDNMHKRLNPDEPGLAAYYNFNQSGEEIAYEQVNQQHATIVEDYLSGNPSTPAPQWVSSDAIISPLPKGVDEISPHTATISWTSVDNADDYKLELATDPGFEQIVETVGSTNGATSYEFTGLEANTQYFARISSNTHRWSGWSVPVNLKTLLIPPGNALAFDGVDGMVDIGHIMDDNWDQITLEAWVKIPPEQIDGFPRIIGNYADDGFALNIWNNTNQPYFEFRDATDNSWDTVMAPMSIADDVWHHIACSYNGTDMKLYLDGQLVSSKNNPGAVIKQSTISTGIGNQSGTSPLNGILDEIRIWNIARTQAEIKEYAHKPLTGSEANLISYFNLDKAEGDTFKDGTGNNDGTMTGGVTWKSSKALITPFAHSATNIAADGFTAHWDSIPEASNYFLRVATDKYFTELVPGYENIEVGDAYAYDLSGLNPNALYFYSVKSVTHSESAWSPASDTVITTGGVSGELAINLNGNNNYIDLSDHIARFAGNNTGAITGWFKGTQSGDLITMTGDGDNSMQLILGDFYDPYTDESIWFICNTDGDYNPSFGVREGHDRYLDNKWHHFALIIGDGNNRFIIDGEEKTPFFHNGSAQSQEFSNISNAKNLYVGKDNSLLVDELAFYNNPITNEEAISRAHKKLTGNEESLVGYYNFDQSTANDASGLGRHATIEGAVSYQYANVLPTPFLSKNYPGVITANLTWQPVDSVSQYQIEVARDALFQDKVMAGQNTTTNNFEVDGLEKSKKYFYRVRSEVDSTWSEFSGRGEFFTLPGNSLALNDDDQQYAVLQGVADDSYDEATFECWIYATDILAKNTIFAVNGDNGKINQVVMFWNRSEQRLEVGHYDPGNDINIVEEAPVDGFSYQWHHVALSMKKDAPSALYVDGEKVLEFQPSYKPIIEGYRTSIGQEFDTDWIPSDFFHGKIDEFRIWNVARTQEQIRQNINNSVPEGSLEHLIAHYTFDEKISVEHVKDKARGNVAWLANAPSLESGMSYWGEMEPVVSPVLYGTTDISPSDFTIHFNDMDYAQSYELEIASDANGYAPPLVFLGNIGKTDHYEVTGLCPGVKYRYRLRANFNDSIHSGWSEGEATTLDEKSTISNLTVTEGDYSGQLKLDWECTNEFLISYFEIKRRAADTDNEFETVINLENNGKLFYTDTTAVPGTYYEYSIQGLSSCDDCDTEIDTSNVGFRLPTLNASTDDGRIRLDWEYADNFAQNLEIVRKNAETGTEQVFQEVSDSTRFCDTSMDLCVGYEYKLVSKTADFGDITSKPVVYTLNEDIFEAIDTLDAYKGYNDGKLVVEWESHKKSIIDEYHISRRRYAMGADFQPVKNIYKGTTQNWIDEDANPGEYYEYRIEGFGTCGDNVIGTDSLYSVGFRQPEGVVNGQISYEGGNPVPDVHVVVDYEEADKTYGNVLKLNGTDSLHMYMVKEFSLEQGLSVDMWIKPDNFSASGSLFQNSGVSFGLDGTGNLLARSGEASVQYSISQNADSVWRESEWNHVAFTADSTKMHLLINGLNVGEATAATNLVLDSVNVLGKGYAGLMEELHLWNTMRTDSVVNRFHSLVLPREADHLIAAYRFDENIGDMLFDRTRTNDEPNKNHGRIFGAEWSKETPHPLHLGLAAKTAPNGNYQVSGIWFTGNGDNFSMTPMKGVHGFDPATRSLLINENSLIHNNQDFTDISAFKVTGSVYYEDTEFPVEGANVLLDGNMLMNAENMPVMTDVNGQFEVEVPIGDHFLSVNKYGHEFSQGYFPPKVNDSIQYWNFQEPVSGIEFFDGTKYKLSGRIVGGSVEGDKPIGFGKSVNNIGQYTVTLTPQREGVFLNTSGGRDTTFVTDYFTGEYEIELLPEVYIASDVSPTTDAPLHYALESGNVLDMTDSYTEESEKGTVPTVNEAGQQVVDTIVYNYNKRFDWIYRSTAKIDVSSAEDAPVISDLIYQDIDDEDTTNIDLVVEEQDGSITHTFGRPVFHYGGEYNVLISLFEPYENYQTESLFSVPVTKGEIRINNELSTVSGEETVALTDSGQVVYTFHGGFPNLTTHSDPLLSYTKKMEINAFPEGGRPVAWDPIPHDGVYRAYLLGAKATGNNFVTTGPNEVKFILRDPPGSNSNAYYEKGFTTSSSTSYSVGGTKGKSIDSEVSFSPTLTFSIGGFGFETQTSIETENSLNVSTETQLSKNKGNTWTHTTTYNTSYQTSDDPAYTGAEGDVFFGNSTNIVYGLSNFLEILPDTAAQASGPVNNNGYVIGTRQGLRINPEFATMFVYTQNHIENYLIPNLEMLRDLQFANNPDKYASNVNESNPNYGTNNDDPVWGSQAASSENPYDGPSYKFNALDADDPNWHPDSVRFYNQQIQQWEELLAQNEREKMEAESMINNISFDAGSIYESSITTSYESTRTSSYEITINENIANTHGVTVNDVGAKITIDRQTSKNKSWEDEQSFGGEKTVGFVLADGDQGDYFTVDVKQCKGGNGPVFITRGGQSSCPYEGEDLSKYYQPGNHTLNYATMRIEAPRISADRNTVANVPEDLPATYKLNIANESETGDDNWFMVKVDPASNPNGAKVKMDGGSINGGMAILVPAGQTLSKTLEISKGIADVNDYEGINIIMHSLCQFDPTDDIADIADTVRLNAHFIPTCTSVEIFEPANNWVVRADDEDKMNVTMGGYNQQHGSFEKFELQYKPASGSQWITQAAFFNDTTNYASYNGEKYKIEGESQVYYTWDMKNLSDRAYDLRVRSICSDGSEFASEAVNGILDGIRPQLFGTPSPADGILGPNDEIMISFNEPIEEGLVSPVNIDVEGVLNGSVISHGASLAFDGANDYAKTPAGINLSNRSFTIEFWTNKAAGATGTVISQGDKTGKNLDIRFSETHLEVIINGEVYAAEDNLSDGNWHHWAVVFDNETQKLDVFVDNTIPLSTTAQPVTSEGAFMFGKSISVDGDYFTGAVHDVRIWKLVRNALEVSSEKGWKLTGNELGLFANWPMDEGNGASLTEIVHSRHATHNAEWLVEPASMAYSFNGTDQSLQFSMKTIEIIKEMDFTFELWFKAPAQNGEAYLFSNGNPEMDAYDAASVFGIKLDNEGRLVVESNSNTLSSVDSYTDDKWHHAAVIVNRRAYATLFIDGEKVASLTAPQFGSIEVPAETPDVFIGARGYLDNAEVLQIDKHFTGVIDEVRIWNSARKKEQIDLYQNNRLSGTEAGLEAYFPFETFEEVGGVMTSAFTLDDLSVVPHSETGENHVGTLLVNGSESPSDVSPKIKSQRPKQSVDFDYVANSDQIIITPTEPLSLIEDCILEITVKYVQDKNGNQMASPATWTAYINKNQMRWQDDYFEFEKEVSEGLSFETMIENTSGVVQSFNLTNIPAWLTVNPVSGIISPNDDTKVTFTVAEGMNIGNYNEDIFLESTSGYNERLTLDMRVFKQAPDWNVDESQFNASMNIIGQVKVQDVFSDDPYDMVGAFAGDECRGVVQLEYKENYDAHFAFLVVYGDVSGEALTYKYWDASAGKVYTDVSPQFEFTPNAIHGNMGSPTVFEVGTRETSVISLNNGWKWISFNLAMENPAINAVLENLTPAEGDVVKSAGDFAAYDPGSDSWIGSFSEFELGKLYRINHAGAAMLEYQGAAVSTADYPVTLSYGWSRIGFVPDQNMTVSEALAGFEPQVNDVIKGQYQFAIYDGYEWIGSLKFMEPGSGYMYNSLNSEDVQFVYPEASAESGNLKLGSIEDRVADVDRKNGYEYSLSMVVRLNTTLPEQAVVQAYIGDEYLGETSIMQDGTFKDYGFLTVFGDKAHLQEDIRFVLNYEGKELMLNETSLFNGNDLNGSLTSPVELSLEQIPGLNDILAGRSMVEVYPNPFSDELNVSFYVSEEEDVNVRLLNIHGQPVFNVPERSFDAGLHNLELGQYAHDLESGIYFIELKSDSLDKLIKVIKK
jgi:hypothetical protein